MGSFPSILCLFAVASTLWGECSSSTDSVEVGKPMELFLRGTHYRPVGFLSHHENSLKAADERLKDVLKREEVDEIKERTRRIAYGAFKAIAYKPDKTDKKLLKKIAMGPGGVWALDKEGHLLYRSGTTGNWETQGIAWEDMATRTKSEKFSVPVLSELSVGRHTLWATDAAGNVYARQGLTPFKTYGSQWSKIGGNLKQVSVSSYDDSVYGVAINGSVFRRDGISKTRPLGNHWQVIQGYMKQVAVGPAGVWGVTHDNKIMMLYNNNYYHQWRIVKGVIGNKVQVGNGMVWVLATNNHLCYRNGISPTEPNGLNWVDYYRSATLDFSVNGLDDQIWLVQTNFEPYYLYNLELTSEGTSWAVVKDTVKTFHPKEIANGPDGVWVINGDGNVYYRHGTYLTWDTNGHMWQQIAGIKDAKSISVGKASVWVVTATGGVFARTEISNRMTTGLAWKAIAPPTGHQMSQISVRSDDMEVWGTDVDGNIFYKEKISTRNLLGGAWKQIPGSLLKVSVGLDAVWGMSVDGDVFYFFNPGRSFDGTNWMQYWLKVDWGTYKVIDIQVGHDIVWVVRSDAYSHWRKGINPKNPIGLSWVSGGRTFHKIAVNSNDDSAWGLNVAKTTTTVYRRINIFWKDPLATGRPSYGDSITRGCDNPPPSCPEHVVFDLVFIIDGSLSVGAENFQKMKDDIKLIINSFEIRNTATRVGFVQFSEEATTEFSLESYQTSIRNKSAALKAVDDVEFQGGRETLIGAALRHAYTVFDAARWNDEIIPKVAVVITDGRTQDRLDAAAQKLRRRGVTTFAVGVGADVYPPDLLIIAGDKQRVETAANFVDLKRAIEEVAESVCKVGVKLFSLLGPTAGPTENIEKPEK